MRVASTSRSTWQQAGLVPACLLFMLVNVSLAHAMADSTTVQNQDSTHRPLTTLGRIGDDLLAIGKDRIRVVQYRSLPELLARSTTALPRSLGGFGQHNAISFMGEDPSAQLYSMHGRRLMEPWSGALHLEQITPEGLERIEVAHGTDAIGLGAGMSLHAINLQQIVYNTATPITRMWYTQGGGELIAGDVTLSQNVAPGFNATLGIRRSGAVGRYDRTDFDVWNLRAALRWTPSDRTHMLVSYDLASLNTDLWGGVQDSVQADISETTSLPVYAALRDESRRHDVQMTATQILSDDRASQVTGSVYLSLTDMLRQRDSTLRVDDADPGSWLTMHGRMLGAQVRYQQRLGIVNVRTGASVDVLTNDATVYANKIDDVQYQAWGHAVFAFSSTMDLRAAGRIASMFGKVLPGGGAAFRWRPVDGWQVHVDASFASRAPTAAEGLGLDPERHVLLLGGMNVMVQDLDLHIDVFHRTIDDVLRSLPTPNAEGRTVATTTVNGGTRRILGMTAMASARWWNLRFDPVVRVMRSDLDGTDDERLPLFSGQLSVAYVYDTGVNSVRFGATIGVLSEHTPSGYVPLTWSTVPGGRRQPLVTNGLDLHLTALVGNASVRLAWENVIGTPWYTVSGYPEIARNVRLSVNWSFFD